MGMFDSDVDALLALAPEVERAGHWLDAADPYAIRIKLSRVNSQHVDLYPHKVRGGMLTADWYEDQAWPGIAGRYDFPVHYLEPLETVTLEADRAHRRHRLSAF